MDEVETVESGIYKIEHEKSGKVYVGSSKDIRKRWRQHSSGLRRKRHHNQRLQRAYNKYGSDAFRYEVLEYCSVDVLLDREQFWMDELDSYSSGYNCSPYATYAGVKYTGKWAKHQHEFAEALHYLKEFSSYRHVSINPDILLVVNDLHLGKSRTVPPKRLRKCCQIMAWIMGRIVDLPEGDYKISHIHYLDRDGSFSLDKFETKSKYSKFNKYKHNDPYEAISNCFLRDIKHCASGKQLMKMAKEIGITLNHSEDGWTPKGGRYGE